MGTLLKTLSDPRSEQRLRIGGSTSRSEYGNMYLSRKTEGGSLPSMQRPAATMRLYVYSWKVSHPLWFGRLSMGFPVSPCFVRLGANESNWRPLPERDFKGGVLNFLCVLVNGRTEPLVTLFVKLHGLD
jgi:hypothetical protein